MQTPNLFIKVISHVTKGPLVDTKMSRFLKWLRLKNEIRIINKSGFFDAAYYLKENPDVLKAGIDPVKHYVSIGWVERRNPCKLFDTHEYLKSYPDIEEAGINPLVHYVSHGQKEGRICKPPQSIAFGYYEYAIKNASTIRKSDMQQSRSGLKNKNPKGLELPSIQREGLTGDHDESALPKNLRPSGISSDAECEQHEINKGTIITFTIISKNYLPYALTLHDSYLKYNPNSEFRIFVVDQLSNTIEFQAFNKLLNQDIPLVFANELRNYFSTVDFDAMLARYSILEMNTAIKPFVIEYLFSKGFEKVIYSDPDIYFTNSLNHVFSLLDTHDVVFTPHSLTPYYDDKSPGDLGILNAGTNNLGFIALSNTKNTMQFVRWWQNKLFDHCYVDHQKGLFVDQKWTDLVPSYFDKVYLLRDKAYNVAYWNLHEREVYHDQGQWKVSGEPLCFFHFSGIQSENLNSISKHQNRFKLSDFPALEPLFAEYVRKLKENGADEFSKYAYYYATLPGTGLEIPKGLLRHNYGAIFQESGNLFARDADKINHWKRQSAIKNNHSINVLTRSLENDKISKPGESQTFGINYIGFFESLLGIGEIGRMFVKKSYASGIPHSIVNIKSNHVKLPDDELFHFQQYYATEPIASLNLVFVNADVLAQVVERNRELFSSKYNIGMWWWEFDDYFQYRESFKYVDEVIVCSDFIRQAIEKVKPQHIQLKKVKAPFLPGWKIIASPDEVRRNLDIRDDDFAFMYSFDYHSSMERKNPEGLIKAFALAFPKAKDAKLLIKSVYSPKFKAQRQKLIDLIVHFKLEDRVILLEEGLSRDNFMSVLNAVDSYVSLHRSEGLGLGMLEAMWLGKPVVGTNYGGNTEFMNEQNSFLVPYTKVGVKEDFGPYKKGWLWAEPSIDQAAQSMLRLYEARAFGKSLGEKAAKSVRKFYSQDDFTKELFKLVQIDK
jgi:glycosyltransferase involved in cell wall biosynthesis